MKNLAPVGFPALAVAADATTPAGSYVGQTIYSTTTNSLLSWNGSAWKAQAAAGGGGSAITVKDESATLTAALSSLNFAGAGVTATASGSEITVSVPGASLAVADEGGTLTTHAASMNFVGGGVTATNLGDNVTVTVPGLIVKDEGGQLTAAAASMNFVGPGVAASRIGNDVTVTVAGSGLADIANLTDATTIAIDASLARAFRVVLGGNRTIGNPSNLADGQQIALLLKQDGAGSRTVSWASSWSFGAGGAPTLSTTPYSADVIYGLYDATEGKIDVTHYGLGFAGVGTAEQFIIDEGSDALISEADDALIME